MSQLYNALPYLTVPYIYVVVLLRARTREAIRYGASGYRGAVIHVLSFLLQDRGIRPVGDAAQRLDIADDTVELVVREIGQRIHDFGSCGVGVCKGAKLFDNQRYSERRPGRNAITISN